MKIGLYGGSFDPVHNGHLQIASFVMDKFGLDKIIFIPTGSNPFKVEQEDSKDDRLKMLKLALEGRPDFYISDFELKQKGKTFTYNTVKHFINDEDQFYFIGGADLLKNLDGWYKIEELLSMIDFIIVSRKDSPEVKERIDFYNQRFSSNIIYCPMDDIEISSSMIRENIKQDLPVDGLIPPQVEEYIRETKIYE